MLRIRTVKPFYIKSNHRHDFFMPGNLGHNMRQLKYKHLNTAIKFKTENPGSENGIGGMVDSCIMQCV